MPDEGVRSEMFHAGAYARVASGRWLLRPSGGDVWIQHDAVFITSADAMFLPMDAGSYNTTAPTPVRAAQAVTVASTAEGHAMSVVPTSTDFVLPLGTRVVFDSRSPLDNPVARRGGSTGLVFGGIALVLALLAVVWKRRRYGSRRGLVKARAWLAKGRNKHAISP